MSLASAHQKLGAEMQRQNEFVLVTEKRKHS